MKIKNLHLGLLAFAVLFFANLAIFYYGPAMENFYIIADYWVMILALLAAASGFFAYRMHGLGSVQGKALFLIATGTLFWALGELAWGSYEIFLGMEKPVASIADVFWFIGYGFFFWGLFFITRLSAAPLGRKKLALVPLVILICSVMIYISFPTITDAGMALIEKTATAGYVLGDMLLLVSLAITITYLLGSKLIKPWSIIFIGLILSTLADIFYTYFIGSYETGNLIDILWNVDYILMGFGFFYYRETIKGIFASAKETMSAKTKESKKA